VVVNIYFGIERPLLLLSLGPNVLIQQSLLIVKFVPKIRKFEKKLLIGFPLVFFLIKKNRFLSPCYFSLE
jgi:hypothetical protein